MAWRRLQGRQRVARGANRPATKEQRQTVQAGIREAVEALAVDAERLHGELTLAIFETLSQHDLADDAGSERIEGLRLVLDTAGGLSVSERLQLRQSLAEVERSLDLKQNIASFVGKSVGTLNALGTYVSVAGKAKFHRPDCGWLVDSSPSRLEWWRDHEDAVDAGKKPCGTCSA